VIAVVGVGPDGLPAAGRDLLAGARLVAGGARHLDAHAPDGAERLTLTGDLGPAVDAIAAHPGPVVVLASGDPGFFGIVRTLAERLGPDRLHVVPTVSSVALAFARAGLPWDDALVVSAHGRDPAAAVAAALAHPKVAVLTAPDVPPASLAAALDGSGRAMLVAERLGHPDERVVRGAPADLRDAEFADPNVVVVYDPKRAVGPRSTTWPPRGARGWALPESAFEHRDGMITKAEVRALALARLGPGPGDLVWDVGAGSGSVAIECARLGAAAVAVERDPDDCERIRRNAAAHGVDVRVVEGAAPAALAALPTPDAVFIGGGGADLPAVLAACLPRVRRAAVVALATIERVVPTMELLGDAGLSAEATMLSAARLSPLAGAHRLAAANPVFVVAGARP
jgi:precorrin-6Y C5,15-methyltransferase (decarboxylating)